MSLNDVNIWVFSISLAMAALSALLPAKRFVGMLQEESYDTKSYLKKMKADKTYHNRRLIFWIVAMFIQLAIYTLLTILFFNIDVPRATSHVIEFETLVATSIASSIIWFLRIKNTMPSKPPERNTRNIRLNILFGVLLVVSQFVYLLLGALLLYGTEHFSRGYRDPNSTFVYLVAILSMMMNLSLGLAPFLLALSANILQPLETLLEKRKINASGHGMV